MVLELFTILNEPEDGWVILVRISTRVVFPAPFLPSRPKIEDLYICKLTPFKAFTIEFLIL